MESRLLFSIIVPVYNIEKYLMQCLESLINQTFTNIEVILINDGSTDNSGTICDQISEQDDRFKVFHTENHGVSSARNLGLNIAKGDYIVFVDSDDWLENDALEKVNNLLGKRLYDLIIYGVVKETNNQYIPMYSKPHSAEYMSNEDIKFILPRLIKEEIINSPFKVYKRELISKHNIRFETRVNIAEDFLFNMECFLKSKSLYIMEDILYHYMIRDNISLTRKFQDDKYQKLMLVNNKLNTLVTQNGNSENLNEALLFIRLKNIYSCLLDIFNKECNYNYQKKITFLNSIKNKEENTRFAKVGNPNYKVLAVILKLKSTRLLYLFLKVMHKMKHINAFT